jgi:hypothetical protein
MKNLTHPAFILGVISIILLLIGIVIKANGFSAGDILIMISVLLAGIFWIWSIIDVINKNDLKPFQKRFWLIAVIAAPAVGGMLFYIMHQKAGRIIT